MKCLNSLCFHLYSVDLCQTSGWELWYSGGLFLGDLHHDTFFIVLIEPIHFCGYTIYLGSTADWTYVSFFYLITCAFVSFFSAEHERQTLMISFYVLGRFSPRHPRALFHILRIQRKHIVVKHIVVHWCNRQQRAPRRKAKRAIDVIILIYELSMTQYHDQWYSLRNKITIRSKHWTEYFWRC
jgi:hypothetical protein